MWPRSGYARSPAAKIEPIALLSIASTILNRFYNPGVTSLRNPPPLVLFPGLGIDGRLFGPQRELGAIEVPPWLDPVTGESLEQYSKRLAGAIVTRPPFYVGGVSFGAMAALEVARHLPVAGVFLISGSRTGKAVSNYLRPVAHASPFLPDAAFTFLRPFVRPTLYMLGEPVDGRHVALMESMFAASPPRLVRWGLEAVIDWQFTHPDPAPVHQIHGRRDILIPAHRVRPDVYVPGGGHLINVTHAPVVNAFIRERTARGDGFNSGRMQKVNPSTAGAALAGQSHPRP